MSNKQHGDVKAAVTDLSVSVLLISTTDGTEVTGKVAADVTASYWRQGGSRTAISVSDLSAIGDAHSDGGWKQVDATNMPGVYRFDIPDAAFAINSDFVVITVKVSGCFAYTREYAIETQGSSEVYSRIGAPVGASISADVAGVQSDTNDIQTRIPAALVSGRMDASVGAMAADVVTSSAMAASAITEIQSGLSTLDAAGVRAAVGLTSANLETLLTAIDNFLDTEVAAILAIAAKIDTALELDGAVYRFTTNALENAPSGGGGGATDWTSGEREQIRHRLGIDGTASAPSADPSLAVPGDAMALADNAITAAKIATDAITAAKIAADAITEIQNGLSTLNAAGVRSAVGLASPNLDTQLDALPTAAEIRAEMDTSSTDLNTIITNLSAIAGFIDTEVASILAAVDTEIATLINRVGLFTGSGANTILGALQALARTNATLPSDIGGTYDPATDSLQAIRDRGDAAWITGGGGGGGGGFDGANEVDITFTDTDGTPIANVTFTVVGVGSATTDGNGVITVNLNDGEYNIRAIPQSGNMWAPAEFTVSGATSVSIEGVAIYTSGLEDRTAAYLVELVRDLIGAKTGQTPFRDGFAADAHNRASKSILLMINTVQKKLSETGYFKCYFEFTLEESTDDARNDQIALDSRIHRIRRVTLTDSAGRVSPLGDMATNEMDRGGIQYENYSASRPTHYWWDGNDIGFNFPPSADYTIRIYAETHAPDLVNETDIPQRLPCRFHEMLAYGAAMLLILPDLGKEENMNIYRVMESEWKTLYEDLKKVARSRPYGAASTFLPQGARRPGMGRR